MSGFTYSRNPQFDGEFTQRGVTLEVAPLIFWRKLNKRKYKEELR